MYRGKILEKFYCFSVDRRLCINSWGEEIAKLTGKNASSVLGEKYYKVFPRIFSGNKDSLLLVLEKNKKIILKGYNIFCLFSNLSADIRIDPLSAPKAVKGVKITFSNISCCSAAQIPVPSGTGQNPQSTQRLIDIGKTALSLAHGVRNPLNAIKGSVVYLSEKFANEPALIEFAKIMEEEISRLDNFISQFLSTSFLDAESSVTDINLLLRKIEVFTSLQAHACNIKSVFEYGNIPAVMLNSFHVEQAILNVINNAIEAMCSGGQLTVKTRSENLRALDFVVIEISDTGPGIPESKINNLSFHSEYKGKGYGLFITREILQYCNGYMEIKSKRGRGTTIELYLPVNSDRGAK